MILNSAMTSEIYAIFSLFLVSSVLFHERHILVLSFVALITFSQQYSSSTSLNICFNSSLSISVKALSFLK